MGKNGDFFSKLLMVFGFFAGAIIGLREGWCCGAIFLAIVQAIVWSMFGEWLDDLIG